MRSVALLASASIALLVAPLVAAAGNAPLRVSVPLSVTARHAATLVVRSKRPQPEARLRVVLVAPKASVVDVVAALTQGGTAAGSFVVIPRDGFAVVARRFSATSWKVRFAFPRAGLWRVVVPNWTLNGYTTPFPAIVGVHVR